MHRAPIRVSLAAAAAAALVGVGALAPARAAERYRLDQGNSTIHFSVGTIGFFRATGHFTRFDAKLVIDPGHPTRTRVSVTIPAASITTPWAQESAMIRAADFLDIARYRTIRFISGNVTALAPGRYAVHGRLTLRGVTRPVTLSARLVKSATDPKTGDAIDDFTVGGTIRRKAFGITADPLFIDDRVRIVIHARILIRPPGDG